MWDLNTRLRKKKTKLAVIGLGYVGMPLAVAFSKKYDVIGFDINAKKVEKYNQGIDPTCEIGNDVLKESIMEFTSEPDKLREANVFIIAVPTPTYANKLPDLQCVKDATETVGKNLLPGSVIVYESTVYPGTTEDVCQPILERESGLKCGVDFKIGYSPERINPADKEHTVTNIVKIVSGCDSEAVELISEIYASVVEAGIYKAPCIRVAEAAKLVENTQRDINIAFLNEVALLFNAMEIDTHDVVDAMDTKWNALRFRPGLVGGHCIAVDPYYFIDRMNTYGINSHLISSARSVNESMGNFVASQVIKYLLLSGKSAKDVRVAILGITFKENCPDTRNTKVIDIIQELQNVGIKTIVSDPHASKKAVKREFGIDLVDQDAIVDADCIVLAVAHREFLSNDFSSISRMFRASEDHKEHIFFDVKSVYDKRVLDAYGCTYWRL